MLDMSLMNTRNGWISIQIVNMNYTREETDKIIQRYLANPTRENVDEIAVEFNRTAKSIIGKLSREGVYKKSEYLTKTGERPVTKGELVGEIQGLLGLSEEAIVGLEKSPKTTLKNLVFAIKIQMCPEELE
jgi:hypothetical protein